MKRKFEEISDSNNVSKAGQDQVYNLDTKRRKIETQKIGDFIVDAKKSLHFRMSSDINKLEDQLFTSSFFSPLFMHWMFGEQERISGYEGLSIDITLSKKRLMPYLQITYQNKAPAFANIDNINEKLEKQYGRIYDKPEDFIKLLKDEENFVPMGEKLDDIKDGEMVYQIYKVNLENEAFHEQNFYLQSLLPFFIDGASVIEPSPFWQYFMVYEQGTNNLLAFATVFEAHHSAVKYRAKISQVFVLPPYQRQGLGQKLYQSIYDHYRKNQPQCFSIIVEDASDDFQRLQDYLNTKTYLKHHKELTKLLESQPISNVILNQESLKKFSLSRKQVEDFSVQLKLPEQIILRLHDLVLYSFLDKNENVQKAFRIQIKKRYYVRCVKDYLPLFKNMGNGIIEQTGGLQEPYIYNDLIEENPFFRDQNDDEEKKDDKAMEAEKVLTQEGVKIQLNTIYNEIVTQYEELRQRINSLVMNNQLN